MKTHERRAAWSTFLQLDSRKLHAQSHTAVVFVGVLFTQKMHCLLIYPYLAVDTYHELQDTLEHLAEAKVERYAGAQKVVG